MLPSLLLLLLHVLLSVLPFSPTTITAAATATASAAAVPRTLNLSGNANLVAYWGQDCVRNEPSLATVCADAAYDAILLSFMDRFGNFSTPHIDLSSHCSATLPNSTLLHCPQIGKDIAACQAMGKTVLLSLGGADGRHSLASRADALDLAHRLWDQLMGGNSIERPFDSAVLDGIDLDIENNLPAYYADLMNELRALFATDPSRRYFISAAPQCVYPDASLGPDHARHNATTPTAISHAAFDWLNMQFYNNDCGVLYYHSPAFNFDQWARTIPTINPNPHIKLMLGVLAADDAGGGYVNASAMATIIAQLRALPAFGGAMIWDDGYAIKNDHFQTQLKKILHGNGEEHSAGQRERTRVEQE